MALSPRGGHSCARGRGSAQAGPVPALVPRGRARAVVRGGRDARRDGRVRARAVAAGIAAGYPNLWLYDGLLMPEALAGLLVALALLVSVRFVRTGRTSLLIWLGVIIGLGALTRGELLVLVPLLVLPLCLVRRERSVPDRLRLAGLATVLAALVIAPWAIYNVQRFE